MLIRLIFFYLCSCHFLTFLHSLFLFVLHLVRAELIGKRNAKPAQGVYDEQEGDGEHQKEEWGEIPRHTERVAIKCTELSIELCDDEDDGRQGCDKGSDAYDNHAEKTGQKETSEVAENAEEGFAYLALFALRTQLLSWQKMPE